MSTTIDQAPKVAPSDSTTPTKSNAFKRHPVLTYFTLTFAISWGGLLIVVGGPSGISAENTTAPFMALYLVTVLGPLVAGILLTALLDGRAGLHEFRSRLLKWRVGARWYAAALLIGPLSLIVTLVALSLADRGIATGIMASDNRISFLLIGLAFGLVNGVVEEVGWTGFAMPKLTSRHGILATGLFVGILWGLWHLPSNYLGTAADAETVPLALYVATLGFSFLPPFRVLMVWLYKRTESLLVAILMHASIDSAIVLTGYALTDEGIGRSEVVGVTRATWFLGWGAVLWVMAILVVVFDKRSAESPHEIAADTGRDHSRAA